MPLRFRTLSAASLAAALSLLPAHASGQADPEPDRTARLAAALEAPGTLRSVFFIRGMSCRACTMLIDRALNVEEGIYWARFNYPLRLFTAYHDPGKVRVQDLEKRISATGELKAVLLESAPAAGALAPGKAGIASWKGGSLGAGEAEEAFRFFEQTVRSNMIEPEMDEWKQVSYEIFGEEARNRIFKEQARRSGYGPSPGAVDLPMFIAKDFYWPVGHLPATAEEGAVARFIGETVTGGREDGEGRGLFDEWLLGLWKEIGLDFRGEALELKREGR